MYSIVGYFCIQVTQVSTVCKSWTIRHYPVGGGWQPAWYLPAWSDMRCKICSIVVIKPANLASLLCGPAFRMLGAVLLAHDCFQIRLAHTFRCAYLCVCSYIVCIRACVCTLLRDMWFEQMIPCGVFCSMAMMSNFTIKWHFNAWCTTSRYLASPVWLKYNTKDLTSPCNYINAKRTRDSIGCIFTLILNVD